MPSVAPLADACRPPLALALRSTLCGHTQPKAARALACSHSHPPTTLPSVSSPPVPAIPSATGCSFQLEALGIAGFGEPAISRSSSLVPNNPLPRPPLGAIRLEARLDAGSLEGGKDFAVEFGKAAPTPTPAPHANTCPRVSCSSVRRRLRPRAPLARAQACARGAQVERCAADRLAVREVYGGSRSGSQFVVFDVLPPSGVYGAAAAAAAADGAVREALVAAARSIGFVELLSELPAEGGECART